MSKYPQIKSLKALKKLIAAKEGDIYSVEDISKYYRYKDGEWKEYNPPTMTLYDLNKQIIKQMPDLRDEDIGISKTMISEYILDSANKFYMLLCHDLRYYTLFEMTDDSINDKIEDSLINCLFDLGKIKKIELTEDKQAIECWVNTRTGIYVAYFFPYDKGVVECQ